MKQLNRRRFLKVAPLTATAAFEALARVLPADDSERAKAIAHRPPKITGIERHEILIPYREFNAQTLYRYHGVKLQTRTIYIMNTDQGLEGLGETWGPGPDAKEFDRYIGTSPFDWLNAMSDLPMNMAVYDLMGKYLGVPAWKLIGPKVRNWIPVGAWTVAQTPEAMAGEIAHAVRLGYRRLKYHIDEVQNVVDQTAAMQKVAPRGFKVLYDFNFNSTVDSVYPIMRELERFPIVDRIEDPLPSVDRAGYRLLREKCRIPILIHHGPVDFMTDGLCDGLITGHAPIGHAARVATIAEHTQTPFMLQQCGGTINQAFLAHEAAVFRMATLEHVNLCHLWEDDVTTERMPVIGSSIAVPKGPGLGVELDRDRLRKYSNTKRPKYGRMLVRIDYFGGPTIFARHNPERPGATDNLRFLNRLLEGDVPGPVPGYANPVRSEFVDETSPEFEELWMKTADGAFVAN